MKVYLENLTTPEHQFVYEKLRNIKILITKTTQFSVVWIVVYSVACKG